MLLMNKGLLLCFTAWLMGGLPTDLPAQADSPKPAAFLSGPLLRYEFSHPQMGTVFRIVLFADDSTKAQKAAQTAFTRIDTLNQIMSDYLADSELSRLSATAGTGRHIRVSPELWTVLQQSQEIARRSTGAFDITVGPYVQLWRRARRQQQLPTPEALAKARQSVGYPRLNLYPKQQAVELLVSGMKLDLGGIAKGYAVDEAMRVLQQFSIGSALVDGGGNMVVSEAPPGKPGWAIRVDAADSLTLTLTHAAVASSGDLYQYVDLNGTRYSHIVDPRTGIGLTTRITVTVVARNGITADYLSTAVSVLGAEKGMEFLSQTTGAAAIVAQAVDGEIKQWQTKTFRKLMRGTYFKR